METKYLSYMKKWLVKVNNKAIAVGNTKAEAIAEAERVIKTYNIKIMETNEMTEQELIQFTKLLEKFIDYCGLDNIEACKKAQELLEIINEN